MLLTMWSVDIALWVTPGYTLPSHYALGGIGLFLVDTEEYLFNLQ